MACVVYSTESCPKCEQLKKQLKSWGQEFTEVNMATPEALTELRINGVFTLSAPVLQMGDDFYTVEDLFQGEEIRDLKKMGLCR
ncbi:MAG: NrdH-redoxin [Methanosarcinales archaeon]|nr:NrdH-redoxin [Methanosarcinales archaeon]